jgi:hypothetical protein
LDSLTLLTGLVGALVPLAQTAFVMLRQRGKESAVQESSLDAALRSTDLKILGAYLDDQLGEVDVARYAYKKDARERVDRVLERLEAFLGPDEPQQDASPSRRDAPPQAGFDLEGLPQDIRARLQAGDEWGALVRLRIALEQATLDLLRAHKISAGLRISPALAMDILGQQKLLSADAAGSARNARSIANRAAHGQAVSPEDVASALASGAFALRELHRSLAARTAEESG